MNRILCKQLALDYCCTETEVSDAANHFSIHQKLEGRRRFQETNACFLKIAVVNGKLLFSGEQSIIEWCKEQYETTGSEWFFEAKNLKKLNQRLQEDGHQIEMVHPFFISEKCSGVDEKGYEIRWYEDQEIQQFRGDSRFDEAYAFCEEAPDVLGVAALLHGEFVGMAGASRDSPIMWQIGINVRDDQAGSGVGTMLVTLLKNEMIERGILPYYGTALSHLASQRVALGAGFLPTWVELTTSRISS